MSKQNKHSHGNHDGHGQAKRKIHHDWRFWVSIAGVVLMLMSMIIYVISFDESLGPEGQVEPAMPAAAE
jgi:hypothetical protein